ncbi:alpha-mannosidase 2-like isoform X2 [Tachypleus tridentatus]
MWPFPRKTRFKYVVLSLCFVLVFFVLSYQRLIQDKNTEPAPVNSPSSHFGEYDVWKDNAKPALGRASSDKPSAGLTAYLWPWMTGKRPNFASPTCPLVSPTAHVDIRTWDIYPTLNFNPTFQTYWNRTFEKRYLKKKENWKKVPLKVFVLPHSHNDPGWLKTFEDYFMSSTVHILNSMLNKLSQYRDMTFVWAEISYLAKYWDSLKTRPHLRETLKDLIVRGQLEIVTGGWVMTDEAAAHYYAMIDQLIEGHQWMKSTLGVAPTTGWSIDPFGHGSTMPYLLRSSGLKNTYIQRTHYAWKQFLAAREQLEFWWRQQFDSNAALNNSGEEDILCHMAPFDLYNVKHACGPDTEVCLHFDFRRVAGEYSESKASRITKDNVHDKAKLLVGQYGRMASLFPHNVALALLGDDFRFNHDIEWDQQYRNYKVLFEYINSQEDWNVEIQFGTLNDYFQEVHQRMKKLNGDQYPTLVGDFHPYGDIYAEGRPSYWTGYFSTRPYWKHLSRELEHWLRSAEILYTLARTVIRQQGNTRLRERLDQDYNYLTLARQSLGLFQHHDAITGTSKEIVMHDYGQQLFRGFREVMGVISHSAQFLLLHEPFTKPSDLLPAHPMTSYLFPDIQRPSYDTLPQKVTLNVPKVEGQKVVVFNSMPHHRQEVIRVGIKHPHVRVVDPSGKEVPCQVNPAWNGSVEILSSIFELVFVAQLPPLSLITYIVYKREEQRKVSKTTITIFVSDAFGKIPTVSLFNFRNPEDEEIVLKNHFLKAVISKTSGLLDSVELSAEKSVKKAEMKVLYYNSEEFHSGAYLFQPNKMYPVLNISERFPIIRVVQGQIISEITTVYPGVFSVTYRVHHFDGPLAEGIEVDTIFDMSESRRNNVELFMRVQSDLNNKNTFYTDSSGFQMVKRYTHAHVPTEANFYPVTSAAYIEDSDWRLTMLMSHAHGCSSLHSGWLEVVLDRRLRFDDSRGMAEGVMDNKRTNAHFWLLLEKLRSDPTEDEVPNLSHLANVLSSVLNYPAIILASDGKEERPLRGAMTFIEKAFPCDVHLVNLRTIPKAGNYNYPSNSSLLILHRRGHSCNVKSHATDACTNEASKAQLSKLRHVQLQSIEQTSLTGIHSVQKVQSFNDVHIQPMEIRTYKLNFAH